jgi:hypothetical protein
VWSCRFWAAYVILSVLPLSFPFPSLTDPSPHSQIIKIRRLFTLLSHDRAALVRSTRERVRAGESVTPEAVEEEKLAMKALAKRREDLKRDCWVQAGYAPLTIHWYVLRSPLFAFSQ